MLSVKAAVARGKGGPFTVEDVLLEPPRADEVLVRLVATGLCHTDLLALDQILPPGLPAVLGHEGSGVVVAVGAGVTSVAPGDPVVLAPMSCGSCRPCLTGHPMHCVAFLPLNLRGRRADGSTAYRDADGAEVNGHFFGQSSFADHVVAHWRSVVKVRADAPLELLGPLGCGLQTGAGAVLGVFAAPPGSSLVVFGAGPVGLAAVMAARIAGCSRIVAVDLHRARLDLALELGATDVFDGAQDDVAAAVVRLSGGGVDFALDAVGLPRTGRAAVESLAVGGTAGIVGSAGTGQDLSVGLVQLLGRTVKGILQGDSVPQLLIPRLLDFFLAGRFPLDRLVRPYPLADINRAVADAVAGTAVKPVLMHDTTPS
ncbi:NAD(P)-dependent alcohol dehydrogenase [Kitasatospora sp. NPDC059327]|uniref:NAD(P)-dependent alcohol dehydrogenase n=1 Tax=Kitasatospora sp. NPDC059327 TaxID=3346803 RepID=UPI00367648AA